MSDLIKSTVSRKGLKIRHRQKEYRYGSKKYIGAIPEKTNKATKLIKQTMCNKIVVAPNTNNGKLTLKLKLKQ